MTKQIVSKIVTELEDFSAKEMKKLTLELHSQLAENTPRRTSWARSNWIPQIGKPSRETDGSPDNVSSSLAQEGLTTVATKYRLAQGPIFISNNVPYIRRLNEGYSKQAPAGFVELSRDRAVYAVLGTLGE